MSWIWLFYPLLALLLLFGVKICGRGEWNEEYTSLNPTRMLKGITILGVALHHMAQKTCAPWQPQQFIVHGLDPFVNVGFLLVAVFFFCSGLGLYKSYKSKPDYLKYFRSRRIGRIIIAFYLSEIIYTVIRLLMGERMDTLRIIWYLSGLHMANFNAWYLVVIPFFYLVFRASFQYCKREGTAIFWVFVFTLAYTVLGSMIDHQNDWWMRGEWWYNSVILFPLGLLFAKYESQITRFFRHRYLVSLLLSFAALFLLYWLSCYLTNHVWGYYGEGTPMKIPKRLLSAGSQWLACIAYVLFWFLLMMKVRIGNKALAWLGAMSLDFYLMHGVFVELFGFNFLNITDSLVYIRSVPLYVAVVLACSVPAALIFCFIRTKITKLIIRNNP